MGWWDSGTKPKEKRKLGDFQESYFMILIQSPSAYDIL